MSSQFLFKPEELLYRIPPARMGLEFTSVQRMVIHGKCKDMTLEEEVCYVVIQGSLTFKVGNVEATADFMDMIYVPRNYNVYIQAGTKSILMRYGAPAHRDTKFAHLPFKEINEDSTRHVLLGEEENNSKRDVWHFIDDQFDACRLLMGLCRGRLGGWTVWPPHEHTEEREEVYTYYDMGKAFGIQCVYEDMSRPLIVAMVLEGDTVSVPKGYHPNVGCPAGSISYIYCMTAKRPDEREFLDLRFQDIYGDRFIRS